MTDKIEKKEKKEFSGLVQMKKTTFESVLRAMSFADTDVFLSFGEKGLVGQMVDPAHIGMVKVTVAHEIFSIYGVRGEGLIAFDAKEVLRWLKLVRPHHDVMMQWGLTSLRKTLVLKSGIHSLRVPLLDTTGYNPAKIPSLNIPTVFYIGSQELLQVARYISKLSYEMRFTVMGLSLDITCATDDYHYKAGYIGGSLSNETKKKVSAMYPAETVLAFAESLPKKNIIIGAHFAEDFPVKFECVIGARIDPQGEVRDGVGVTCFLAPKLGPGDDE